MGLIVQKYGGTSVGSFEKIQWVADKIIKTKAEGHDVVVVVSAMSGETDALIHKAHQITEYPNPREMDVLLATGEQVSIALLSMALIAKNCPARSYTAPQVRIVTDSAYTKARILDIEQAKIREDLALGRVVIIAGFQGIDHQGDTTTLGRGGSDTTAVAVAAALGADECRIYTDVQGVYTTDPRIVPQAKKLDRITFDEMLEMSSLGSKVLQIRAVEFAGKYRVPVRVLSTFVEGEGTLITFEDKTVEAPVVSGIAFSTQESKLTLRKIPDRPGIAAQILQPVSEALIDVDMVIQNASADGNTDFTFTVNRNDYCKTREIVEKVAEEIQAMEVVGDNRVVKVSIVGVGMRSHSGIASKMFKALGAEGINIQLITTSEIKVSVMIEEKYLELAVRTLHTAFGLDKAE